MFCSKQVGKCSSNSGKVNFEGLVHLLRYIGGGGGGSGLRYYAKIEDAPLSDLLRQASSLIPDDSTDQILVEVQYHVLCFIKVYQLIISHMLQIQLLNKVLKVRTIQQELQ